MDLSTGVLRGTRAPPPGGLLFAIAEAVVEAAVDAARERARRRRRERIRAANAVTRRGWALHPGEGTPLWNELVRQVTPHLARRGSKARLARQLGLPRQRLQDCLKAKRAMLDAERTLLLLAWLSARQEGRELPTPPPGASVEETAGVKARPTRVAGKRAPRRRRSGAGHPPTP